MKKNIIFVVHNWIGDVGYAEDMSKRAGDYLPFRGLSAWFSSSVRPTVVRKWDQYGGTYAVEEEAEFLFSDSASAQDTIRVYGELPGVSVFLSSWISEILHMQCHIQDIPLGRHILLPKHLQPSTPGTASKTWTNSRDCCDSGRGGTHLGGEPVGVGVSQHRAVLKPVLQSGADSDAEWESLTNLYKKAKLDDIVHIKQLEPVVTPYFRFIPELPQFVIKRRKSAPAPM